jgi:hypothetical protein
MLCALGDLLSVQLGVGPARCTPPELEDFMHRLDHVIGGMPPPKDASVAEEREHTIHTLFLREVKDIGLIQLDIHDYNKVHEDLQSYKMLRDSCERVVEIHYAAENQKELHKQIKNNDGLKPAAPGSILERNGTDAAPASTSANGSSGRPSSPGGASRQSGRFSSPGGDRRRQETRSEPEGRSRSYTKSPGGTYRNRYNDKRPVDGYRPDKRPRPSSGSPGRRREAAYPASPGTDARSDARGRLGSSPGGRNYCFDFTNDRCRFGDKCRFSHATPSASAPKYPENGKRTTTLSPASKKEFPCYDFQKNICNRGSACIYGHFLSSPAKPAAPGAIMGESSASRPQTPVSQGGGPATGTSQDRSTNSPAPGIDDDF